MITILSLLLCFNLSAKKFSNAYMEFDIPDDWHCKAEGGQHVCQAINPEKRKEAIVVMASKYQGAEDTLKRYEDRLNTPKTIKDLKGAEYKSKIQYTKYTPIEAVPWVDSMQEDSEVPGFYTRYLATVHNGVGIAITFSAHKSKFEQYKSIFFQMVKTLRIKKDIPIPERLSSSARSGSALDLGFNLDALGTGDKPAVKDTETKALDLDIKTGEDTNYLPIILIVLGALVVLFIIRKIKK